jgi:hypothetical protein
MSDQSGIEASSIHAKVAREKDYVLSKGKNLDMWMASILAFAFIGVGSAITTDSFLSTMFLAFSAVLAVKFVGRVFRIKAARGVVDAAWKSALPLEELHSPSGERVKFIRFRDNWSFVEVEYDDGERQRLPLDTLFTGSGEKIVYEEHAPWTPDIARQRRWSNVNWRLDDGRTGFLRDVVSFGNGEDLAVTLLTLKLEDGNVVTENIDLLTPVAR